MFGCLHLAPVMQRLASYAAVAGCDSLVKCLRFSLGCWEYVREALIKNTWQLTSLPDCNVKDVKVGTVAF